MLWYTSSKDPVVPIRLQYFKDVAIASKLKGYLETFEINKTDPLKIILHYYKKFKLYINANLGHSTLVYLVLINVTCKVY